MVIRDFFGIERVTILPFTGFPPDHVGKLPRVGRGSIRFSAPNAQPSGASRKGAVGL